VLSDEPINDHEWFRDGFQHYPRRPMHQHKYTRYKRLTPQDPTRQASSLDHDAVIGIYIFTTRRWSDTYFIFLYLKTQSAMGAAASFISVGISSFGMFVCTA
jgi:hypothetical protein